MIDEAKRLGDLHARTILAELYPAGKFHGHEFTMGNLNGDPGESFSFNLVKGIGMDFEAGIAVDIVGVWAARKGLSQREAAKAIVEAYGNMPVQAPKPGAKGSREPLVACAVVPQGAGIPPDRWWSDGQHRFPVKRWEYRNVAGELVGYTCRFEREDPEKTGVIRKDVIPQTWTTTGGWGWTELARPIPLYGSEMILSNPEYSIAIVEGEKTADAARQYLAQHGFLVLTYRGGGGASYKSDWQSIKGRSVLIVPDNDKAGITAAEKIKAILSDGICSDVRIAKLPPGLPDKWDLADDVPDDIGLDAVIDCILDRNQIVEAPPAREPEKQEPCRYKAIGWDRKSFYFLNSGGQVCSFSASGLTTPGNILSIQPERNYWRKIVSKDGDVFSSTNCHEIAEKLIIACHGAGIFAPEKIRGVGAWEDNGRIVFHAGDQLNVDGVDVMLHEMQSRYVYERSYPLAYTLEQPHISLPQKFRKLCESLSWESPISGLLFAGWCILAPMAGLLPWRPHVWLTAPPGGGKTWVINHIARPVLGPLLKMVQGATTEAGLRQLLGSDARPILFDEAESEDDRAAQVMQNVLQLVRQSSSDGGSKIVKGSQGGTAVAYESRAMYMFCSIAVALRNRADVDRVTVLAMRHNTTEERDRFKSEVMPLVKELTTERNMMLLRSFAIVNAAKIRSATKVFSEAVAEHLKSARHGDQLGALLAGAAILRGQEVDMGMYESVLAWVRRQNWSRHADDPNESDEKKLLATIQQTIIRVRNGKDRDTEFNVAQLVNIVQGRDIDNAGDITLAANAASALALRGIKVAVSKGVKGIAVSNSHTKMREMLADTAWGSSWRITLARLPDAVADVCLSVAGEKGKFTLIPERTWEGMDS